MDTPSQESQQSFYSDRWKQAASKPINGLQLQRLIGILSLINELPQTGNMKILDLGSGTGWLSSVLSNFGKTTGVELSIDAVRTARQQYPRVEFRAGDLFEKITEEGAFDLVVSQEVIEHMEDQQAFVDLAARALKVDGYFIFTTPNAKTQARRTQEEHEAWGMQPIENWIGRKEIRRMLAPQFAEIRIKSIIDGFGQIGLLRVANSVKVRKVIRLLGLTAAYSKFLMALDFGLHLIVVAKRIR